MLQNFEAQCSEGQAINTVEALLGRMGPNQCISQSTVLGCFNNVTGHVQGQCDGRQECSFFVSTLGQMATNCPRDLVSYLYVYYTCVEGKYNVSEEYFRGITRLNGVFPKWKEEFRESDKSLKHELGSV